MKTYIRRSQRLGDGARLITYYTPSDYLFLSIIKLLFFLFLVWPIQILWWIASSIFILFVNLAINLLGFVLKLLIRLFSLVVGIPVGILKFIFGRK